MHTDEEARFQQQVAARHSQFNLSRQHYSEITLGAPLTPPIGLVTKMGVPSGASTTPHTGREQQHISFRENLTDELDPSRLTVTSVTQPAPHYPADRYGNRLSSPYSKDTDYALVNPAHYNNKLNEKERLRLAEILRQRGKLFRLMAMDRVGVNPATFPHALQRTRVADKIVCTHDLVDPYLLSQKERLQQQQQEEREKAEAAARELAAQKQRQLDLMRRRSGSASRRQSLSFERAKEQERQQRENARKEKKKHKQSTAAHMQGKGSSAAAMRAKVARENKRVNKYDDYHRATGFLARLDAVQDDMESATFGTKRRYDDGRDDEKRKKKKKKAAADNSFDDQVRSEDEESEDTDDDAEEEESCDEDGEINGAIMTEESQARIRRGIDLEQPTKTTLTSVESNRALPALREMATAVQTQQTMDDISVYVKHSKIISELMRYEKEKEEAVTRAAEDTASPQISPTLSPGSKTARRPSLMSTSSVSPQRRRSSARTSSKRNSVFSTSTTHGANANQIHIAPMTAFMPKFSNRRLIFNSDHQLTLRQIHMSRTTMRRPDAHHHNDTGGSADSIPSAFCLLTRTPISCRKLIPLRENASAVAPHRGRSRADTILTYILMFLDGRTLDQSCIFVCKDWRETVSSTHPELAARQRAFFPTVFTITKTEEEEEEEADGESSSGREEADEAVSFMFGHRREKKIKTTQRLVYRNMVSFTPSLEDTTKFTEKLMQSSRDSSPVYLSPNEDLSVMTQHPSHCGILQYLTQKNAPLVSSRRSLSRPGSAVARPSSAGSTSLFSSRPSSASRQSDDPIDAGSPVAFAASGCSLLLRCFPSDVLGSAAPGQPALRTPRYFCSDNMPFSWIGVDFKQLRIRLTHYSFGVLDGEGSGSKADTTGSILRPTPPNSSSGPLKLGRGAGRPPTATATARASASLSSSSAPLTLPVPMHWELQGSTDSCSDDDGDGNSGDSAAPLSSVAQSWERFNWVVLDQQQRCDVFVKPLYNLQEKHDEVPSKHTTRSTRFSQRRGTMKPSEKNDSSVQHCDDCSSPNTTRSPSPSLSPSPSPAGQSKSTKGTRITHATFECQSCGKNTSASDSTTSSSSEYGLRKENQNYQKNNNQAENFSGKKGFRRLRLIQTGRNSHWGHELCVHGLEFYGQLFQISASSKNN